MADHVWENGDELLFRRDYGRRLDIHKITKITASGRIKCGPYDLNPDLRIRGERGWDKCYRGEPVTDEIRVQARRQKNLERLKAQKWDETSDDILEAVVMILT